MNYPVWELGMGAGVLMAWVSILHVFVSHFAVGGGLWLVVTEMRARKTGDKDLLQFVKSHSRFFMLLTLVFGAISGVGIWTTIGLISPHGTSALIHGYVWGWAMEWVFFFLEICSAIVYYYGWERLDAHTHQMMGWIYFISAFMSLVIINGIVTFMLTPGGWLENHQFWTGFFNPTYWPSVLIRTFGSFAIAGIFTLMSASFLPRSAFRTRVTRWNASWVLVGMIVVAFAAKWYGGSVAIWRDNEALLGAIPVLPIVAGYFKVGILVMTLLALVPLIVPKLWNKGLVAVLILCGLLTMGAGEWTREAGRKPFTIQGYLYSTGMLKSETAKVEAAGMVASAKWISPDTLADPVRLGHGLFLAYCQPCHTLDGYNGLRPYLAHWDQETVASLVPNLGAIRALMPPWYGTENENEALTAYLMSEKPTVKPSWPDKPEAAGPLAFKISCGLCHTVKGFRSLGESFEGMGRDEIDEFLDSADDVADEMPAYYGNDRQRKALIHFLETMSPVPPEDGSAAIVLPETSARRQS